MTATAHTYHPSNSSLAARVRAYKTAIADHRRASASLKLADDPKWRDTLGSKEEIADALVISEKSLGMALSDISEEDWFEARNQGLLAEGDLAEYAQMKRQQKMQSFRAAKSSSRTQHRKGLSRDD
ncbi:hypothetical protein OAS86_01270 [Gammaproteobacteria bacterium]|nr:hypothetical protein [Gammaproteobacteria bacterium]